MVQNSPALHLRSMTERRVGEFRTILREKQTMLEHLMLKRDGIAVERSADPSDEAQHAIDRDLSVSVLDHDAGVLSAVRSALRRIERGAYGVCQSCDCEISDKRLAAMPWALYCIECQENLDREGEAEETFAA